jgi:hypothetical protein
MTKTITKGIPKTIITNGDHVEVWISSPTGDSSDSLILHIPCFDNEQAKFVADAWTKAWFGEGGAA